MIVVLRIMRTLVTIQIRFIIHRFQWVEIPTLRPSIIRRMFRFFFRCLSIRLISRAKRSNLMFYHMFGMEHQKIFSLRNKVLLSVVKVTIGAKSTNFLPCRVICKIKFILYLENRLTLELKYSPDLPHNHQLKQKT